MPRDKDADDLAEIEAFIATADAAAAKPTGVPGAGRKKKAPVAAPQRVTAKFLSGGAGSSKAAAVSAAVAGPSSAAAAATAPSIIDQFLEDKAAADQEAAARAALVESVRAAVRGADEDDDEGGRARRVDGDATVRAVLEHEDKVLAHVGGDVGGSAGTDLLEESGPAFGPLPPPPASLLRITVPHGSKVAAAVLRPAPDVSGADPFVADLLNGCTSETDVVATAREALLSTSLASHCQYAMPCVPEPTLRWLFTVAVFGDSEAARAAGGALLAACITAWRRSGHGDASATGIEVPQQVAAALECARMYVAPPRRSSAAPANGGQPAPWLPGYEDFVAAFVGLGVLGLTQQQQDGDVDMQDAGVDDDDDDVPPGFAPTVAAPAHMQQQHDQHGAPMPLNVPLVLALLPCCLAARAALPVAQPDASCATQLLVSLARMAIDPHSCDVAREPSGHAILAVVTQAGPHDRWMDTLRATAQQLAVMPPSPAGTAAALHTIPLSSGRCRRLRAVAALATLRQMPCCVAPPGKNNHGADYESGGAETTAEAARACVSILSQTTLSPKEYMRVIDYAALCAALRLGDAAVGALVAHAAAASAGSDAGAHGSAWGSVNWDVDDAPASAYAALDAIMAAWRAALQRVAKEVRPSALNLAAVAANGEAARLLARYGRRKAILHADGEGRAEGGRGGGGRRLEDEDDGEM